MTAARKLLIKNDLLNRCKALGNTKTGLKEVCSDLVNNFTGGDSRKLSTLSNGTFLSPSTLERISTLNDTDTGEPYRPQAETLERILRFFNAEISFSQVKITSSNMNRPKNG